MSQKVLITDDDLGVQDAFRIIFERAGYETTVLASATPIINGTAPIPDIYILDKQLSGVDGLDVCRFLKETPKTAHIPVIIISASPNIGRLAKAACADAFLEKPFKKKDLLDLVARHLAAAENKNPA